MFDKYGLIDAMIKSVDALADARGTHKCALVIEIVQQLGALKKGLGDEEAAYRREIDDLKRRYVPADIAEEANGRD